MTIIYEYMSSIFEDKSNRANGIQQSSITISVMLCSYGKLILEKINRKDGGDMKKYFILWLRGIF